MKKLTSQQAANTLMINEQTLRQWRSRGVGPSYVKGPRNAVSYEYKDVLAWIRTNTKKVTPQRSKPNGSVRRTKR